MRILLQNRHSDAGRISELMGGSYLLYDLLEKEWPKIGRDVDCFSRKELMRTVNREKSTCGSLFLLSAVFYDMIREIKRCVPAYRSFPGETMTEIKSMAIDHIKEYGRIHPTVL